MTEVPYLAVADLHLHDWSLFGHTDAAGLNSRLHIQLNELTRAADELKKRGGSVMIYAGDLFHVRGMIDPEVFNPTHSAIGGIAAKGIHQFAIPGNHDLKGRETTELGNSFQTLKSIDGFRVITKPGVILSNPPVAMIPWCSTKDMLRTAVKALQKDLSGGDLAKVDLIIHAGIDGVLEGVPAGGLPATEVASWGFKRVFAGDYHNYKVMESGKVISIGASCHQNWGDIGSSAGFVFVYPDRIEWQSTHAPEFIEITGDTDPDDIPALVDGNYVRIRSMKLSDPEITKFRGELEEMGARGVTFQVSREAVAAREGAVAGKASTLDESVDKFVDTMTEVNAIAVKAECVDVLNQVRSVAT